MSETPPSGPPWWQTLPGIMTGLAAVITAVTGLVVAFNHTSTSTTRTEEPRPSPQPQAAAAAPASPPPSSPSRRPASAAAAPSIAVPSIDRVKLAGGDAVITILSAQIEPIDLERRALKFRVRYMNGGRFPANFWSSSYRLIVDDVPRAPTNALNEVVDANSAKEGDVVFDVPAGVKDVVLQISAGDEKSRIPVKVP